MRTFNFEWIYYSNAHKYINKKVEDNPYSIQTVVSNFILLNFYVQNICLCLWTLVCAVPGNMESPGQRGPLSPKTQTLHKKLNLRKVTTAIFTNRVLRGSKKYIPRNFILQRHLHFVTYTQSREQMSRCLIRISSQWFPADLVLNCNSYVMDV
jgi:hypothetical protein